MHSDTTQTTGTGPAAEEEPVVLEDSEQDEQRMRELEERIEEQGGVEPDEPDTATRGGFGTPQTMIAEARKHLGYRETGTNDTKFNRWLGKIGGYPHDGYGYPWCHAFISYCLWHSDNADAGPRTAGCLSGVAWFRQRKRYSSTPQVGDIVYYGANGGTHVELVVGVGPDTIQTIGGNTSGSVGGSAFFNGNGVYAKTVRRSSRIHGYGRPAYSSGGAPPTDTTRTATSTVRPMTTVRSVRQQQEAVNSLGHTPRLDVDGEWGPKTEAGVKWLQKKVGAGADGEWGPETERLFTAFRAPAAAATAETSSAEPAPVRTTASASATPARARVRPMTTVRSVRQQQEAVNSLGYAPRLDVDGEWGPKTEAGVKWLQKKVGAGADGEWGPETERLFAAFGG